MHSKTIYFLYGQLVKPGQMQVSFLACPRHSVLEWWANKIVRNKTASACPYVQYRSNGSNLHVEQNQFITILRNLSY